MHSTTIVIVFLSVGSVVMDSNIKELCSKGYFDSYVASYSTGPTDLKLSRKVDSTEKAYHSWNLLIEYQNQFNGFKTKQNEIQYILKDGQIPKRSLTQPIGCAIDIAHRYTIGETNGKPNTYDWVPTTSGLPWEEQPMAYNWDINDLVVFNSMNGPTVGYTHKSVHMTLNSQLTPWRSPLLLPKTLNGSIIWFSGLLCATKGSENTIYLIAGNANSVNDVNRIQFVGRLEIYKREADLLNGWYFGNPLKIYDTSLEFSLESINQTVIEFLGIDCQNITTIPTVGWNWFQWPTKTLYKIFWSLVISGAILSIIDFLLVIKRGKPKIPSVSAKNRRTSSTSNAKTMDTLTLVSDTK